MATTAIATELLVLNTAGANLVDAGGGSGNGIVATTPTDGWVVSPPTNETFGNGRFFLRLTADGSGDTFTIKGGQRYPGQRVDLGDMTVVLAASQSKFICVETSRFLRQDGTIIITATDAGSVVMAEMLPRAG